MISGSPIYTDIYTPFPKYPETPAEKKSMFKNARSGRKQGLPNPKRNAEVGGGFGENATSSTSFAQCPGSWLKFRIKMARPKICPSTVNNLLIVQPPRGWNR